MRVATWGLLAGLAAGCGSGTAELKPGQLEVAWQGFTTGGAVLRARAVLCPEAGLAELFAIHGDTGVAFALFPLDSARLVPVTMPVFHPATPSELRPGATVALRWFDVTTVDAFESTEGEVRLAEVGDRGLTGDFQAALRGVSRSDSLTVTGRFRRVPLVAAPAGCADSMRRHRVPVP